MKPVAAAVEGEPEVRTARPGDFLFVQDFTAGAEAVVNQHIELAVPPATRWNSSPANVTFEAGDALVMIAGVGRRSIFCDRRISWHSTNWLDGRSLRACLVDEDRNGVFDRVMWAGAAEGQYTPMFIMGYRAQNVEIPFTVRTDANPRLMTAGPVITRSALGAYRVAFAIDDRHGPVVLGDLTRTGEENRPSASGDDVAASATYFYGGDLPITVAAFGARVEIVSIDDGAVSYRILSQFPETLAEIGYSGSMPSEPHEDAAAN